MATSSVWITIASILATFDITKAVGEDGKVIEPNHAYFPGLVTYAVSLKSRNILIGSYQHAAPLQVLNQASIPRSCGSNTGYIKRGSSSLIWNLKDELFMCRK
jgi:hypothetical protein